ncbi:MAG: hypothetical protein FD153_1682, partial [Rhodospirillaceae bacterium]
MTVDILPETFSGVATNSREKAPGEADRLRRAVAAPLAGGR